jgi:hypothetical protein
MVLIWVAGKIDTTVDAFCKSFGTTLGAATSLLFPAAVLVLSRWYKPAVLIGTLKDWVPFALVM